MSCAVLVIYRSSKQAVIRVSDRDRCDPERHF